MMQGNGYSAIVTGASRGIGRAIAARLASEGYIVLINYAGSAEAAQSLADEIQAGGGSALCHQADVSDAEQVKGMVGEAEKLAPIGALVNNAGIARDALMMRMSEQDFDRTVEVNLKGAFLTMRQVSSLMMRRRFGSIVNISSVVATMGNPGQTGYAAAKAGLIGLTKAAARELAPRGITVNAVLPGFIDTDMTQAMPQAAREQLLGSVPLRRAGEPSEVAAMVAFLCGEGARYITGHQFYVDGGLGM